MIASVLETQPILCDGSQFQCHPSVHPCPLCGCVEVDMRLLCLFGFHEHVQIPLIGVRITHNMQNACMPHLLYGFEPRQPPQI